MTEKSDPIFPLHEKPWKENDNPIWLASTLKFHRNVNKYLFPSKLEGNRQAQLLTLIENAILPLPFLQKPTSLQAKNADPSVKQFLSEHFLASESFHEAHAHEGFIFDASGLFLLTINIKDHVQMQMIDCKGELENTWNQLVKVETGAGKALDYAFSSRFGFLTSQPAHCGTGFVVRAFLHLPALIHTEQWSSILGKELDEGVAFSGMQGDFSEIVGDIVILYNTVTLGVSEEEILKSIRTSATKVMIAEKSAREHLKGQEASGIKNIISRAYGLIAHSYQLDAKEALEALSLLKLGHDLGVIKGISHKKINELLFACRRGHLIIEQNSSLDPEHVAKKRAEFLHSSLKDAQLTI